MSSDTGLTCVVLECTGRGAHRPRSGDTLIREDGGWTSGTIEIHGEPEASRLGVLRDDRGTWHLTCPTCRRPPRRLSAPNMDRLLDAAVQHGVARIDLSHLAL